MRRTQDPGTISHTEGTQGVNKLSEQERTTSGNTGTRYHRLLHRHCASLDLETAFKQTTISKDIQPELCKECRSEQCRCPAFTPEMPCSSASSMPTNNSSDHEDIPKLVENNPLQVLYPPQQSPSDEEVDQEVAAICRAPIYYRVRSQLSRRHRYYMYNALDSIEEMSREKRRCENSPHVQGAPVEH